MGKSKRFWFNLLVATVFSIWLSLVFSMNSLQAATIGLVLGYTLAKDEDDGKN